MSGCVANVEPKAGLEGGHQWTNIRSLSAGIRVNAVSPGIIKTPMHPVEAHPALGALHPMGRMGDVSDIVDAVVYLDGAGFVTGEVLHVDGGQAAGHHQL
jgi:NAD(P)-dependent dehydrogenase (short-subunit alcohol dehydrogenase family)